MLQTQAYWVKDERVYVVMELADGSLRERLKHCKEAGLNSIPLGELMTYFREAAEALDFLHQNPVQRVVHRDIKPENILLLQGHAKVADFGLVRVLQSQQMSATGGGGAGTPRYMAPEIWDSKRHKVGPPADEYSLAMTYIELRLGHAPFPQQDMMGLMMAHLTDLPELAPLPEAERAVLLKAVAKEPAGRYATCKDFVRALEQAVLPELQQSDPGLISFPGVLPAPSLAGSPTPYSYAGIMHGLQTRGDVRD